MRSPKMWRLSVLPCVIFLTACAANSDPPPSSPIRLPAETRTEYVYQSVPQEALACLAEPPVPAAVDTDAQLAAWAQALRDAGADCRAKLNWLRDLVATWPK